MSEHSLTCQPIFPWEQRSVPRCCGGRYPSSRKVVGMRIGIIGSGMIGGTLGKLFATAGHEVALSNSRGPDSLRELVEGIGPNARALTVDEAASFGEVVLLAVPFRKPEALPSLETVA